MSPTSKIHPSDIARAMQKYGGSFAVKLGAAILIADEVNREKIKATWPDLWETYGNLARREIEQGAAYEL